MKHDGPARRHSRTPAARRRARPSAGNPGHDHRAPPRRERSAGRLEAGTRVVLAPARRVRL